MRLVYVDEAGIANPRQEPFAVVAAIIIHADSTLVGLERYLDRLVERHIPEAQRDNFVFHAAELFNGGGKVFVREPKDAPNPAWPLEKRLLIADQIAKVPAKFGLEIAVGWVDRRSFAEEYQFPKSMTKQDLALAAHVFAFLDCAMRVEQWMRQKASNEVCLLIVEDNDRARRTIRDLQVYYQNRKLDIERDDVLMLPFRKIKEEPLFQPKRRASVLQIADFVAYVFKRVLMSDERYERFFDPMRRRLFAPPEDTPRGRRGGGKRLPSHQNQAAERSP